MVSQQITGSLDLDLYALYFEQNGEDILRNGTCSA